LKKLDLLSIFLCISLVSCSFTQPLSSEVIFNHVSLIREGFSDSAPSMIVIASLDEIVPPAKGVNYPGNLITLLNQIDYEKSFVIFFMVGQVQGEGILDRVTRSGSEVTVWLYEFSVGPGNYEIEGFTMPYQMITVGKTGTWGDTIHFQILTNQNDIVTEIDHYIP
jgi:hypothetical protein